MERIGLGGSCHWCMEAVFLSLKGIAEVKQGWISPDGSADSFSEAIWIVFDPGIIPVEKLIEIHLRTHSATADHSLRAKYRSAIYVLSDEQRRIVRRALASLQVEFDHPLITTVIDFGVFRENEPRYRNYYYSNPEKPFCRSYIDPKLSILMESFRKEVNDNLTQSFSQRS